MKLTAVQKESLKTCVYDLQCYYDTCGNEIDFENIELLKIVLNSIDANLMNIEVTADVQAVYNSKKQTNP